MVAPGTRLGPYEIIAPLGAGGMGEVWRARDTRLGRDVAVKVLPQHLAATADARARMEREARAISGLNHPHICTLYDIGHEGDVDFLVMELIEGETLAARLERGAMPAAELLPLAIQITEALDAAHRQGIIHRDLKPGNVMLTRSGAKLMDFGLARAAAPTSAPGDLTSSLTISRSLTAEGQLVGTFLYMAPGAAGGRRGRRPQRPLGPGLRDLRDGHRHPRLRRQEPGQPDRCDHARRADGAGHGGAADPARPGPCGHSLSVQGSERAHPDRPRREAAAAVGGRRRLPGRSAGAGGHAPPAPGAPGLGAGGGAGPGRGLGRDQHADPRDAAGARDPVHPGAAARGPVDDLAAHLARRATAGFPGHRLPGRGDDLGAAPGRVGGQPAAGHRGCRPAVLVTGQPLRGLLHRQPAQEGGRGRRAAAAGVRNPERCRRHLGPRTT